MKKRMQRKTKENRKNSVSTFDHVNEIRNAKTTIHRRQQNDNDFEINEYDSRKLKIVNRFEKVQSIEKNKTTKYREVSKKENRFKRNQQTQKNECA